MGHSRLDRSVLACQFVSALVLSPRRFATDCAYHCPPRAVAIPRALSASAISLSVRAPAFCASRMIGSTFAAICQLRSSRRLRRSCEPHGAGGYQGSLREP
jgi:hypothetical protein